MGSILSAVMVQGRVSVGASGAFMGLLGATLSSVIVNWKTYPNRSRALMGVIFFTALNTAYGLLPLVDNFMHVGGALMGFLVGNLFLVRHSFRCWKSSVVYDQEDMPAKRKNAILLDVVWLLSLGIVIAFGIMGLFALFSGILTLQHADHYINLFLNVSNVTTCSGIFPNSVFHRISTI
jgi:membrane associated rhomboid family serine protease